MKYLKASLCSFCQTTLLLHPIIRLNLAPVLGSVKADDGYNSFYLNKIISVDSIPLHKLCYYSD